MVAHPTETPIHRWGADTLMFTHSSTRIRAGGRCNFWALHSTPSAVWKIALPVPSLSKARFGLSIQAIVSRCQSPPPFPPGMLGRPKVLPNCPP